MTGRFEARKDAVHPYYGVFDTMLDTWHVGDYADATYAAGVPSWKSQARAAEVATALNAIPCVFVVEQFIGEDATEVVGGRLTLDSAKALGEAAVGPKDQWGGEREWAIEWRPGAESTLHDPVTLLNTWDAYRPAPDGSRTAYLRVSITEHRLLDAAAAAEESA